MFSHFLWHPSTVCFEGIANISSGVKLNRVDPDLRFFMDFIIALSQQLSINLAFLSASSSVASRTSSSPSHAAPRCLRAKASTKDLSSSVLESNKKCTVKTRCIWDFMGLIKKSNHYPFEAISVPDGSLRAEFYSTNDRYDTIRRRN